MANRQTFDFYGIAETVYQQNGEQYDDEYGNLLKNVFVKLNEMYFKVVYNLDTEFEVKQVLFVDFKKYVPNNDIIKLFSNAPITTVYIDKISSDGKLVLEKGYSFQGYQLYDAHTNRLLMRCGNNIPVGIWRHFKSKKLVYENRVKEFVNEFHLDSLNTII